MEQPREPGAFEFKRLFSLQRVDELCLLSPLQRRTASLTSRSTRPRASASSRCRGIPLRSRFAYCYRNSCALLPLAHQLLYSERFYYCTHEWRELRQFRRQCLTRQAVEEHVEYAKRQLQEHLKRAKAGKRQYHTIRILFAAEDIAAGHDICLWLEGARRELVMKVRPQ